MIDTNQNVDKTQSEKQKEEEINILLDFLKKGVYQEEKIKSMKELNQNSNTEELKNQCEQILIDITKLEDDLKEQEQHFNQLIIDHKNITKVNNKLGKELSDIHLNLQVLTKQNYELEQEMQEVDRQVNILHDLDPIKNNFLIDFQQDQVLFNNQIMKIQFDKNLQNDVIESTNKLLGVICLLTSYYMKKFNFQNIRQVSKILSLMARTVKQLFKIKRKNYHCIIDYHQLYFSSFLENERYKEFSEAFDYFIQEFIDFHKYLSNILRNRGIGLTEFQFSLVSIKTEKSIIVKRLLQSIVEIQNQVAIYDYQLLQDELSQGFQEMNNK